MSLIRLSGAAWSLVGATLQESADIFRALGIFAMDLIAKPGTLLDTREMEHDPRGQAARVANLGIGLSNLIYVFGTRHDDRAINSPDRAVREQNKVTFGRVLEFCVTAKIESILVLPGVNQPGLSHDESLKQSAETMLEMSDLANKAGLQLVFEPHIGSLLESPFETLVFLQHNPPLRIALDYSHFIAQGYLSSDVDPLVPYARHVHLRQAANEQLQVRWNEGEIDFAAVIGLLKKSGYSGYVTLEYEHEPAWKGLDRVDVMTETIRMRNAVRPLL